MQTSEARSYEPLSVWDESLVLLRRDFDSQIVAAYLEPLTQVSFDEASQLLTVSAPSRLVAQHVEKAYLGRIVSLLRGALGFPQLQLQVIVDTSRPSSVTPADAHYVVVKKVRPAAPPPPTEVPPPVEVEELPYPSGVNPRYTFDNFVVGSSNQFSHAAAMRVAEQPGISYNPLFIYGGVGLGKTHILHAICNSILARRPKARVMYMSSEMFTNELIQALRHARMEEFKRTFRNIEVLLIDDIQFMRGKERTQEEFFHTFNALYNAKHQIVITSDTLPQDIPGIEERLRTRFAWGLTADLQAPDFETRMAILNRRAAAENITVSSSVVEFIAENVSSNVRELEGALTRLQALSSLQGTPISLAFAQTALRPLLQPKSISISVDDIKGAVAEHFSLRVTDLASKRRTKNLSFPRHIAMYLCRKHTTASYPEIGMQFGGRDHSSVIHAASVVSTKVETSLDVKDIIKAIELKLRGD